MNTRRQTRLRITDQKSFVTGLLYIAFGLGSSVVSTDYTLGNLARLGPGYFPLILGILLVVIGLIVSLRTLGTGDELDDPERKLALFDESFPILVWIIASVVLFGLMLKSLGLIPSVVLLVVISGLASHDRSFSRIALSAAIITLLSVLAFKYGLGLMLPLWPGFI